MPKRLTPRGEAAPPVDPIVTGATLPDKDAKPKRARPKPKAGVKYVRNLHHIEARVHLANGRDIELKPRGQREDIDIVNVEEQQDPKFIANRDLVFEILEPEVAEAIIAKQQTNARVQRDDGVWAHLRNEKGEAYQQTDVQVEIPFEQQGIVVARVEDAPDGRNTEGNKDAVRVKHAGPDITSVPGSPGHPATDYMQSVPGEISPEDYHEFLLWRKFREQQARGGA